MTANNTFSLGQPEAVTFDLQAKTVHVYLEKTNRSLESMWAEQFSEYPEILLCLSGGLDSQFSAHLAKKHCKSMQAYTFQYFWNDDVVNSSDVLMAARFCQKHQITHHVVDIDLKHFLDNELTSVAKNYYALSPQIACHLYAIEQHLADQNLPVLMGGEFPVMGHQNNAAVLPFRWPSSLTDGVVNSQVTHFRRLVMPYVKMASDNHMTLIRDPFLMSSEIYYKALIQNFWVFENKKIIANFGDTLKSSVDEYKQAFYNSFGFDFMMPLKKFTGFERLKVHLAMQTGRYNEFDCRYRYPLFHLNIPDDKSLSMPIFSTEAEDVLKQAQNIIDNNCLVDINSYSFDW